jgi:MarR family transcriptional regulator, organic hydroperoxide resistance regulator
MDTTTIIARISALRNKAHGFLTYELHKAGLGDIAPSHGFILYALFKNDGSSMKEITSRINKKKNTVTVLIEKLAAHGFIKKAFDTSDRRTTRIFLSKKGKTLEKSFNTISEKLLATAYHGFTENEKITLLTLLDKMNRNFK